MIYAMVEVECDECSERMSLRVPLSGKKLGKMRLDLDQADKHGWWLDVSSTHDSFGRRDDRGINSACPKHITSVRGW
jgi:hypothetical protein